MSVAESFRFADHRRVLCEAYAISAAVTISVILILLLDRRLPVEISRSEILPSSVTAGDTIEVQLDLVEKRYCRGNVFRRIVDSTGVVHPYIDTETEYQDRIGPGKIGEKETFSRYIPLPKTLPAGPAAYAPIVEYWCNPLQYWFWKIRVEPTPIPFDVKAPVTKETPLPRAAPMFREGKSSQRVKV